MKFQVRRWDVIDCLMRESKYDPPKVISFPVHFGSSGGNGMQ